jgi:hypothetical protein
MPFFSVRRREAAGAAPTPYQIPEHLTRPDPEPYGCCFDQPTTVGACSFQQLPRPQLASVSPRGSQMLF